MTKNFIPAISIIIPLYNAERYIGDCLESIAVQTFKDFEVILVDDCSTDNSTLIIENYRKIFGDKIKFVHTNKNSGSAGTPRNLGVKFSRGEYLFFMDSDDAITKTALEELYTVAKDFDADVVSCEKYYLVETEKNLLGRDDYKITWYNAGNFVSEPTLLSENFADRVRDLQQGKFMWNLWTKLIRRDFFVENNIKHLNCMGEDAICTICLICSAKKFLRIPNIVNIYRMRNTSISNSKKTPRQILKNSIESFVKGAVYLDSFLSEQKFFQNSPESKFLVIDILAKINSENWLELYRDGSIGRLDDLLFAELNNVENLNARNSITAFLFNRMNFFDVLWDKDLQKIQILENKILELQNKLFK